MTQGQTTETNLINLMKVKTMGDATTATKARPKTIKLLIAFAWVTALIGYTLWSRGQGLTFIETADSLLGLLADNWWGVPLFVGIYVARPVILFPASLLTILSGIAFGFFWGAVLTVIASNLSTAANYAGGRFFASPGLIDKLPGKLSSLVESAIDSPFETTLIMRLVAVPFDAVGYIAGFAKLKFVPFIAGSALGTVAGTIAFVGFGASIESITDGSPMVDLTLIGVSILLTVGGVVAARVLRKRRPSLELAA